LNIDLELNKVEEKPKVIPTLFDIHKSFNVIKVKNHYGIKGEFRPRMVIFTNFILGNKPIILTGPRGSGKSLLMKTVCTYAKNPGEITAASEKADYRDTNLNEYSHFIIPEINKISDNFLEVLKDIGEGEKSTYKVLDAYKMPTTYTIDPKPFISSIADENPGKMGDELISRLTVIRTDSSLGQNKSVIEYKLSKAQNPFFKRDISQVEVKSFRDYVKSLPDIKEFTFIYLPGQSVIKAIPPFFTDSRRDIDKYLENTYGIALFHLHDRMIVKRGKKELLLITPADAWYNHIIFNDVLVQSSLKCSGIEKIILELLASLVDSEGKYISLAPKEIHTSLVKKGFTPNLPTIKKYCKNLYSNGYLIQDEEKKPFRYESSGFLKDFVAHINWKEVVDECKKSIKSQFNKEVSDEYIKRFCGEDGKIIVNHPFTGEEINLLEFKEEAFVKKEVIKNIKLKESKKGTIENLDSFKTKVELPNNDIEDGNNVVVENIVNEPDKTDKEDKRIPIEEFMEMYGKETNGEVNAIYVESYYSEEQAKRWLKEGIIFEPKNGRYKLLK